LADAESPFYFALNVGVGMGAGAIAGRCQHVGDGVSLAGLVACRDYAVGIADY